MPQIFSIPKVEHDQLADGTVFHMKNDAICWPIASFQAYTSKLLPTLIFTISTLVQNLVGEYLSKSRLPKRNHLYDQNEYKFLGLNHTQALCGLECLRL